MILDKLQECETFHFIKTDPSGNTTILVMDAVPEEARGRIARSLMREENLAAEQVAFLEAAPPRECDMAISMMGGEFCGNAVRSAAAYQVFDRLRWQPIPGYGTEEHFDISCSGIARNVECIVRMRSRNTFDVTAEMPLPESICEVSVSGGRLWRVALPGITHYCFFSEKGKALDKKGLIEDVLAAFPVASGGAAGILFWDGETLDPFVYVKDTDTLVNESSCGSGTASIAACMAFRRQGKVHIEAEQKGGLIYADADGTDGTVSALRIGGLVRITAEGIAYI